MLECSRERPWGVHAELLNDADCPRCGWTAPGPAGDALLELRDAVEEARARAGALGWEPIDGGGDTPTGSALWRHDAGLVPSLCPC
ncbi:MAG TPA: hypothetical protein VGD66_00620 [Allosphingosinicella sp.]|jgi:hypothetical protein